MGNLVRHRQTKGAATAMLGLPPLRHTPTLPRSPIRRVVSDRLQSADFRTFPDRALERRGSTRSSRYRQPRFERWRPYLTVLHQLSLRMRDSCGGMILPSVVRTMNKTPDRLYSDPRPIGFGAERRGPRRHTPSDSHSGWRLATIG